MLFQSAWHRKGELGNLKSDLDAGRDATKTPGTSQLTILKSALKPPDLKGFSTIAYFRSV